MSMDMWAYVVPVDEKMGYSLFPAITHMVYAVSRGIAGRGSGIVVGLIGPCAVPSAWWLEGDSVFG